MVKQWYWRELRATWDKVIVFLTIPKSLSFSVVKASWPILSCDSGSLSHTSCKNKSNLQSFCEQIRAEVFYVFFYQRQRQWRVARRSKKRIDQWEKGKLSTGNRIFVLNYLTLPLLECRGYFGFLVAYSSVVPRYLKAILDFFERLHCLCTNNRSLLLIYNYGETPPYGHLGNTSPCYYDHVFLAAWQNGHTFSCKKKPLLIRSSVNTANFFGPIGERINGVPLYVSRYQKQQSVCVRHGHNCWFVPYWLECVVNSSCSKLLSSFASLLNCYKRVTFTWKTGGDWIGQSSWLLLFLTFPL